MKFKSYLEKCRKEKRAIGQFNFSTLDQLKAISEASEKLKTPVILGTSKGEASFFGMEEAFTIVSFYRKKRKTPVFLNLDHGVDLESVKKAVDAGYDMVHFDGSKMAIEDNAKETIKVLKYAHRRNVLVEGEVGHIYGKSALQNKRAKVEKEQLASINDIRYYLNEVEVDLLALAVGNVHGVYSQSPVIDFNLLKEAQKMKVPLVLHGGSGVSDEDIRKSIRCGVVKINVNTELRIAWKKSLEKKIKTEEFAPYKLLSDSQKSVALKVEEKIRLFGVKK